MTKKSVTTADFLTAFSCNNPFSKGRVSGAGDLDADVPTIHGEEFKKLLRRVERVGSGGASSGLLILGGAGVGKSHLLARLFRWAEDKGAATVLFLHNILASSERLPRYLLRASVSILSGLLPESYGKSELYRLLRRAIRARLGTKVLKPPVELAAKTLEGLAREIDSRRDIARAFVEFYRYARGGGDEAAGERASAAVEWLSGENIGKEAADSLHLTAVDSDGAMLADDAAVELVFCVLAHLGAVGGHPLVLCVDSVDNLDPEKVKALAAFLQVLLDRAERMLVIISGIKQTMLGFREERIIPEAAWDRIAQYKLELARIVEPDARELIKARIEQFARPFQGIPKVNVKRRADELFPLDEQWLGNQLSMNGECRPRDVITWARDRWEQQQDRLEELGGAEWMKSWPGKISVEGPEPTGSLEAAIDAVVATKLVERINERKLRPSALPPDADNLATLCASLLEHCCSRDPYSITKVERCPRGKKFPVYDLLVRERGSGRREVTTGVLFISSENATKMTNAVKRVVGDPKPPDHRIIVTDEERRPLKLGDVGKRHWQALKKLGKDAFHHSALRFEGHAALDALFGLIASARVGDLEVEYPRGRPRRIEEAEALESLHRQNKFAKQPLLRELLTEEVEEENGTKHKNGVVVDKKRVQETILGNLSWRLCLTSREIAQEFIKIERLESSQVKDIHEPIKEVALSMHEKGFLHATAVDDYLYLQYLQTAKQAQ